MRFFRTEKEADKELRSLITPIPLSDGKREYAKITYGAWLGYKTLLDMGESDESIVRSATKLQTKTGLTYETCFIVISTMGPWDEDYL